MSIHSAKLILNVANSCHQDRLMELINDSARLECVVAFAKRSGWREIAGVLRAGLVRGMSVRITAGLSFFQTEPGFLHDVFQLSQAHPRLQLYIGDTPETFHPKIYAFGRSHGATVVIGSANLTSGGLYRNYEASVEVADPLGDMMTEVADYIDSLIEEEVIEPATAPLIADYQRKFEINRIHQGIAHRRASKAMATMDFDVDTLQAAFNVLKEDDSDDGFAAKVAIRRERQRNARVIMQRLISTPPTDRAGFLSGYEALVGQFSSGGLHRGKTRIAGNFPRFLEALHESQGLGDSSPAVAFAALAEYFSEISNAGINLLTEILLALNHKRFANMNQNSVAGMARANITRYPANPSKKNVDPALYAEFCREADRLRIRLGMDDFIELDTLFNHLYWT